jgi:hypothetical protein
MRIEAVRAVTAWLKGDTYGYAAKLAALTMDGSDTRPTTVLDASIVDETDNANAAFRRFDGLTLPALIVTVVGDIEHSDPNQPQTGDRGEGYVTVQVRYAERNTASQTAIVNGTYAIRAVIASLREFHKNDNVASRTRNSIRLVSCESLVEQGVYEEVEDAWLLAAVQMRYFVVNLLPLGA